MRSGLGPALESPISQERPLSRTPFSSPHDGAHWVIEVLGPAGAGKSTLVRVLRERGVAVLDQLPVPWPEKFRGLGYFAKEMLPAYLHVGWRSRWFNLEELRRMLYVKVWHRVLTKRKPAHGTITLLDHGPIFMLGMLKEFGPEIVRGQHFARWSEQAISAWSNALDLVLWLDAPDRTLLQRIEFRKRHHIIKGKSPREARDFLRRCRLSFEQILSEITRRGRLRVLRFDTSNVSPEDIVGQLLQVLTTRPAARKGKGETVTERFLNVSAERR
jgi:RNase adaptor protein for sRNA GlmZ degradation